jgi:hypothetical protein
MTRVTTTTHTGLSLRQVFGAMTLVGIGMFLGSNASLPTAEGQIVSTPQPQHMLSGGQLSVPILQDISATLKEIDGRLSRMETVAKQMSTRRGN